MKFGDWQIRLICHAVLGYESVHMASVSMLLYMCSISGWGLYVLRGMLYESGRENHNILLYFEFGARKPDLNSRRTV